MDSSPILTPLLRLSWTTSIFLILLASLPFSSLSRLRRLILSFAGRGKILRSPSLTVPQSYFLHFYAFGVAFTTCLMICVWLHAYKEMLGLSTVTSHLAGESSLAFRGSERNALSVGYKFSLWRTVFLLLMMEVQVVRRLYETVAVFDYSHSARLHVMGYFTGFFFYTAAPLSLASTCVTEASSYAVGQINEFIVKGQDITPAIEFSLWELLKPLIILGWCQWIGFSIFLWGWLHQLRCHAILGSLRKHKGAHEYVIPYGDWFEYVSCPHYLSEIVIYAGILLASGGLDITIWLLFSFVVANLAFAAAETHRWYRQKFEKYPPSRRAIIPFVY